MVIVLKFETGPDLPLNTCRVYIGGQLSFITQVSQILRYQIIVEYYA